MAYNTLGNGLRVSKFCAGKENVIDYVIVQSTTCDGAVTNRLSLLHHSHIQRMQPDLVGGHLAPHQLLIFASDVFRGSALRSILAHPRQYSKALLAAAFFNTISGWKFSTQFNKRGGDIFRAARSDPADE
jgi:hypothetical protein